MSEVVFTGSKEAFTTGYIDNLVIGIWRAEPTLAAIELGGQRYKEAARRTPRGLYVMVVVEDNVPLPDTACRKAISDTMAAVERDVVAIVGVQEATGFRGAALRSVILSLSMMSGVPYKTNTVANVREGAVWMAGLIKPALSAVAIESAVSKLRQRT